MEPEISLPYLQEPAIGLYPEHMHLVYTLLPYFSKIHSNIFPSTSRSSEWYLSFRFTNQNILCTFHLSHAGYIPRPISSSLMWSVQVRHSSPASALCSQTPSFYVLLLLGELMFHTHTK